MKDRQVGRQTGRHTNWKWLTKAGKQTANKNTKPDKNRQRIIHYLIYHMKLPGSIQHARLSNGASHCNNHHIHQDRLIRQICWQNLVALCGSAEVTQGECGSEAPS